MLLTTEKNGTRYVTIKEIAQCEACQFLLIHAVEMTVFGQVGVATTMRFTDPHQVGESLAYDFSSDSLLSVCPLYLLPSEKPNWAWPEAPVEGLHYLFERPNSYERD